MPLFWACLRWDFMFQPFWTAHHIYSKLLLSLCHPGEPAKPQNDPAYVQFSALLCSYSTAAPSWASLSWFFLLQPFMHCWHRRILNCNHLSVLVNILTVKARRFLKSVNVFIWTDRLQMQMQTWSVPRLEGLQAEINQVQCSSNAVCLAALLQILDTDTEQVTCTSTSTCT